MQIYKSAFNLLYYILNSKLQETTQRVRYEGFTKYIISKREEALLWRNIQCKRA